MIHKRIQLKEGREDVHITTYFLDDSPELLNGNSRPTIIICPGGAYMSCSDREGEAIALRFNSIGYHALVLSYSVLNKDPFALMQESGGDLSSIEFNEDNFHPEPIRDIGRTFIWLKEHREEFLINMEEVILCGFSAGGHNVLNYGCHWDSEEIIDYFHMEKSIFKPAAIIAGYPLTDYVYMSQSTMDDPFAKNLFDMSNSSFLGQINPSLEVLDAVSPARHVTERIPPIFLWANADDSLVPVNHSILMAGALTQNEIPFELHIFQDGGHGLALANQATAQAKSQIRREVEMWFPLVEIWLNKRFALTLPEKTEWEND